jgi:hypothetical protein
MTYARVRRFLLMLAAPVLLSPALAGLAATSPAAAATAAPAPARTSVLVDCLGHGRVRPHSQILACADGNDQWTHLRWSRWRAQALATGTEVINTCVPTCVGGTFRRYPVIVVLWRLRPRDRHPHQAFYSRATVIYTMRVPAGFHRSRTLPLTG